MMADVKSLVDAEHGLVSRRIFIERDIYEQELGVSSPAAGCFCAMTASCRTPGTSSRRIWAKTRSWWCGIHRDRCMPF